MFKKRMNDVLTYVVRTLILLIVSQMCGEWRLAAQSAHAHVIYYSMTLSSSRRLVKHAYYQKTCSDCTKKTKQCTIKSSQF